MLMSLLGQRAQHAATVESIDPTRTRAHLSTITAVLWSGFSTIATSTADAAIARSASEHSVVGRRRNSYGRTTAASGPADVESQHGHSFWRDGSDARNPSGPRHVSTTKPASAAGTTATAADLESKLRYTVRVTGNGRASGGSIANRGVHDLTTHVS
jgi:hypothetical protein